jgi:succinate dehydrogenase / fumarate reductase flavoprotein subunit
MYHQFKELADVDITAEPMEVGPTCHYVMGGVAVEPDSAESEVPGLFAAGEVAGGMHGANRLGGNSLSDLLVFGRRAGLNAAYRSGRLRERPQISDEQIREAADAALVPFAGAGDENPYTVQSDLQDVMHSLVGIIRTSAEIEQALKQIAELKTRAARVTFEGHRQYNPGWHLALDLKNMLRVSECIARAALERTESRGGHTRDDYPTTDDDWGTVNLHCVLDGETVAIDRRPLPQMPDDLRELFK